MRFKAADSIILILLSACASAPLSDPALDTGRRASAYVPHPDGTEISDLRAIFSGGSIPNVEQLKKCDLDYEIEKKLAANKEALFFTFPQHVKAEPERYHWCFYFKLLSLREMAESKEKSLEEKQNLVLEEYGFISYLARIFQVDLDDPRYLRQAIQSYRDLSKKLFITSVRPSSATADQLGLPEEAPSGFPAPTK